jgi:phosphatidylglycerophosphate synthase
MATYTRKLYLLLLSNPWYRMTKLVTIEEIRKIGQPKEILATHSPYSIHVLRKISPYFTKFFITHGITANQVSIMGILIGILSAVMLSSGAVLMFVGCLFYQFWNLFDSVDGEIARVTDTKTRSGKYLETIGEAIAESCFVLFWGVGLSRMLDNVLFLYLGLIFAVFVMSINCFARTRDELLSSKTQTDVRASVEVRKASGLKEFYKKLRILFIVFNGYLIVTALVILELLLPYHFQMFGVTLNLLACYFLLYGVIWVVRTVVSSAANYMTIRSHMDLR